MDVKLRCEWLWGQQQQQQQQREGGAGDEAGDVGNAEVSLWPHLRQNVMKALHKAMV